MVTETRRRDNQHGNTLSIGFPILSLIVCLTAIFVSVYLSFIHYKVHTDASYSSFCSVSQKVDCESVALSPYSTLLDVPISIWGTFTYLVFLLLSASAFLKRRVPEIWPWGLLFWGSLGAVLYSVYLASISHFVIESICVLCLSLHVLNVTFFITCVAATFRLKQSPWRMIAENATVVRERWRLSTASGILAAAVTMSLVLWYPKLYEHAVDRTKTPVLELERRAYEEYIGCPYECPAVGLEDAEVTIIEYTDYQCRFCYRSHQVLSKAGERFPGVLRVVHRHYPLDHKCNPIVRQPFHRQGCDASKAAICAHEQGKFYEYSELLWKHRGGKSSEVRLDLARQAGLDAEAFKECLASPLPMDALMRDIVSGMRLQVRGTPTFLINGRLLKGALTEEGLERIIRQERSQHPRWKR